MIKVPTALDCMSKAVLTLQPDMDVYEAVDILLSKGVSGAPVVDGQNHLIGILTEKDCLRLLSRSAYNELAQGTVADYMSEPKAAVQPEMDLYTVAQEFLSNNFAVLPVLDNGKLVGRVTRRDILRAIQELQKQIAAEKAHTDEKYKKIERPTSIQAMQTLVASQKPEQLAEVLSRRHE